MSAEDRIIDTVLRLDALADLPRTGWAYDRLCERTGRQRPGG